MFDDKYLVYSRARCSALFISPYFEFNELSLFHLRYYLPHSSTKWVVEASLPYVRSLTFVYSGPATLASQIYKSFF